MRKRNPLIVAFFFVSLAALPTSNEALGQPIPEGVPMPERTTKEVETLREESTEESLQMLSEVEMFYWPGAGGGGGMPARKGVADWIIRWDIETIMSNRRFLKLMDELSRLPKAEAARLVAAQIGASLPKYKEMFEAKWEHIIIRSREINPIDGLKKLPVGLSLKISNNPDNSPTLLGLRFQLLSLVLIAGNLKLYDASAAIRPVVDEAIEQREYFYTSEAAIEGDRQTMLESASLYNTAILGTAVIGVSGKEEAGEAPSARWETRRLPLYYAPRTRYDILMRGAAIDYSDGSINVRFAAPIGDREFDTILREIAQ